MTYIKIPTLDTCAQPEMAMLRLREEFNGQIVSSLPFPKHQRINNHVDIKNKGSVKLV